MMIRIGVIVTICLPLVVPMAGKGQETAQKQALKVLIEGMELTGNALKSQNLQIREIKRYLADGLEATAQQITIQKRAIEDIKAKLKSSQPNQSELESLKKAAEDQGAFLEQVRRSILLLEEKADKNNREFRLELEKLYKLQGQVVATAKKAEEISKNYFEDFSGEELGFLPKGWKGNSLTVQKKGNQHILQMRELGTGFADLPVHRIDNGFYLECNFSTFGYVNKRLSLQVTIQPANGTRAVSVEVVDLYPNCDVRINGKSYRMSNLRFREPNCLLLTQKGRGLQVLLNGESVHALPVQKMGVGRVRIGLSNSRDSYDREDTEYYPSIYSIRMGPARP